MSRAFVKEDDQSPPPPPFERPVSSAPNLVTWRGARLIDDEIQKIESVLSAASEPDEEAALRRDLRYWTTRRATAQIVAPGERPQAVAFGTRVTIRRGGETSEIEIVGEDEADPAANRIAWTSPLARAIEEAEPGETVEFEAGGRTEPIEIVSLRTGDDG